MSSRGLKWLNHVKYIKVHMATKKNCGRLVDKITFFFFCRSCPYSQINQRSKDCTLKEIGDEVKQSGLSKGSIYSLT